MKTLVIATHPSPEKSRINRRWLEELSKFDEITINNLSEKYPDEIIDKEAEQSLLLEHDRIIFQYPCYWYNIPALLRKWQDLVLEFGFAFGPNGSKLTGKDCIVAVSAGGSKTMYQPEGSNRFTLCEFLKPMQQTANRIGMKYRVPFIIYDAFSLSDEQLEESAVDYTRHILNPELDLQII